ncbi:MAG: hypothetical protein L0H73_03270 [Nitrococcus sp.]|nr:hypothetical protein [Nitrococcus sp.]
MTANVLLAGPILRRAEPDRVCIWLATRKPVRARAEIFELGREPKLGPRLGAGDSEQLQLGPCLFVHLIQAVPDSSAFLIGRLLGYDIELFEEGGSSGQRLGDLGLLEGPNSINYTDLPLPSFFLAAKATPLNLLHGSCRLLHGNGEDAFSAADGVLARHAEDIAQRPSALYLTGDQIYGDDVAGPLIAHLNRLGCELLGEDDDASVPGTPKLSELGLYGREELAQAAGLTSTTLGNHLMSFGEFAAMHLLAWNVENWPAALPRAAKAIPSRGLVGPKIISQRRKYAAEAKNLGRARRALRSVQRVLANTPTYMIFDDHDVSDDWNLTAAWRDGVYKSPTGRRLVANALAAYWAFQGWGNDPDCFDQPFKDTVSGFLSRRGAVDAATFEETLWSFERWCFHVPTDPPTIFLDTRTQRDYDADEGAAHLIGKVGRRTTRETIARAGHQPGEPLIFVSPVPLYCLELQERRQKFLKDKVGPYAIDLEGWHSNLQGLVDWMAFLIGELRLPWCLILSGDVHYGMNLKASFSWGNQTLVITQLVSSALKHSGSVSRTVLNLLGKMVGKTHERIGWERPPKTVRVSAIKRLLALQPATTDAWNEDAPVFLAPRRAQQLGIEEPPHYREEREYVSAVGPHTLKIVGNNNTGLLSISGNEVTHQLLCPTEGEVRMYTAAIDVKTAPEGG